MTEENRRLAVQQQLAQADVAHREAVLLRDAGLSKGALSRLYYALFHTVVALLLTEGIEARRHRSLPHLLSSHFGALLSASEIASVGQMAANRDLADYAPVWLPTAEMVAESFASVDALTKRIRDHLTKSGWTPTR